MWAADCQNQRLGLRQVFGCIDREMDQHVTTLRSMLSYPSPTELLAVENLPEWIDRHFLRADPYAFSRLGRNNFPDFVQQCAGELDIDPNGVYCIGSGAIGLSFNPKKMTGVNLKKFDRGSDLDIAIISPYHFETAWRDLRIAAHPAYSNPSATLQSKIGHQRNRMFDGAIVANKLMSNLTFGRTWGLARTRMQLEWQDKLEIQGKINMWVYRDYWSVRSYVAEGIQKCREKMRVAV